MTISQPGPLHGERVLIVEDRYLIAAEVAEQVRGMGGEVIGPSRSLESALEMLSRDGADLALLDVSLDHENVYPLATQLEESGVPFIFLTGYDVDVLPVRWRDHPRIAKPINKRVLREELVKLRATPNNARHN